MPNCARTLTVIETFSDRKLKRVVEQGRVCGLSWGMDALAPYDMNTQAQLCLAWMHGQWMGSMGRDRKYAWRTFIKTDSYKHKTCITSYDLTGLDIDLE